MCIFVLMSIFHSKLMLQYLRRYKSYTHPMAHTLTYYKTIPIMQIIIDMVFVTATRKVKKWAY